MCDDRDDQKSSFHHANVKLSRSAWQDRYVAGQTGWDRGECNPLLVSRLDGGMLEEQSRIMIPGCGRGHEVLELARRGHRVTAVDFADLPITALKANLADCGLSAQVVQVDLFEFQPDEPFDAIYEQTSLCAIQPDRRSEYEVQLARWLKPKGILIANFMQSNRPSGPPYHCELSDMRNLFCVDRWIWPVESEAISHPSGMQEIAVVLTRRIGSGTGA